MRHRPPPPPLRRVQAWEVRAGRPLVTLRGHTKRIHSLALHPAELLLASSSADR